MIGVGPVVGAVEREVTQCGERGFEKFSKLNVVGGGPAGNLRCLCGEELSRIKWSFCPGQRWGSSSKKARNSRQRSRPDPVEDLACGQVRVQCGDHVPHPAGAAVAGPWPHRVPGSPPGTGGAAAAGSGPDSFADHPRVRRRVVNRSSTRRIYTRSNLTRSRKSRAGR